MALILQSFIDMSENFLGDLSQVKFFDILKPLLTDKKTGKITIRGQEEGEIYLESGDIVHARTNHFTGDYAFFTIMGWKAGKIVFDPRAAINEKTIPITTEQLLLNWSSRKQEFEKIKETIPSPHIIYRLSLQKNEGEKHISPDQWSVLVLCNGTKTVAEITKSLGWDEYKTFKTVYQLVQSGLLERVEDRTGTKKRLVKEDFFSILDTELKKAMGPVAPFIIDDKLIEFGEQKETFPQERALSFIEALSEEIPNPSKRNEFLKTIMKLLSF